MTVKELEQALDLPRASIRYYEQEGLVEPIRLSNGYRDYTQADLETLEKVKLLRALGLSVEDIRAVQRGERTLAAALEGREADFSQALSNLEAARALCRALREQEADYAGMDARRYLNELSRLSREGVPFADPAADALPTVGHPWARYFARSLDVGLCSLMLAAVVFGLLRFPVYALDSPVAAILIGYLSWGLLLPLETLLLCTWGYTPGKWAFGLKVRDAKGNKLTASDAWARTVGVFQSGEGFLIPFYALYRNWKCCNACTDGAALPWEEGLSYTIDDRRAVGGVVWVLSRAGMLLLTFALAMGASMPRCRTPLSVADFARGYNDVALQFQGTGYVVLGSDGTWIKSPEVSYVYSPSGSSAPYEETVPPFTYRMEDGAVTGVSLHLDQEAFDAQFFGGMGSWEENAVLTLLGARGDVGPLGWAFAVQDVARAMGGDNESWSVTVRGLALSNEVTYSGYEDFGGYYLSPSEGQEQTYTRTFTAAFAP